MDIGTLTIAGRQGFQKIYDLTENVIPATLRDQYPSNEAFADWSCASAIARLGFATPGKIARLWNLVPITEATDWRGAVPTATGYGQSPSRRPMAAVGRGLRVPIC